MTAHAKPAAAGDAHPVRPSRFTLLLRQSLAPALVLLAPFVVFLKYQGYAYYRAEVLLCAGLIAAVSLALGAVAATSNIARAAVLAAVVTLLVDIQFSMGFWFHGIGKSPALVGGFILLTVALWRLREHASRAITLMAGTVLASTILIPAAAPLANTPARAAGRSDLPLILHVILDEHIGIDGLQPDQTVPALQSDLRSFYQSQGFRTFDAAYSEYARTQRSLAHLLNFLPSEYHPELVRLDPPGFNYGLTRNAYFSQMMDKGYTLQVYESDWIQLCPDDDRAACHPYSALTLSVLQNTSLSTPDKARLLVGTFLVRSKLHKALNYAYLALRTQLAKAGVTLPWNNWFYRIESVNSMQAMKRFARDLSGATRGEFFFAHFMMPHSPFVYGDDCSLLPLERWEERPGRYAHPSERLAQYARYDLQVRCTTRMVREFLDAIPATLRKDAIVIVQGDHGSRLGLINTGALDAEAMTPQDQADNQSTLFVVRAPGLEVSSDHRFKPISCILRSLVAGEFRALPGLDECAEEPVAFVGADGRPVLRIVLEPFSQPPKARPQ